MDSNPYTSPSATEPLKVRSRLMTYLDIGGIICAATPLIYLITLILLLKTVWHPSLDDAPPMILGLLLITSFCLWVIGAVYNVLCLTRRRTTIGLSGIIMNVASLLMWLCLSAIIIVTGNGLFELVH
jgi:hypothetical protein